MSKIAEPKGNQANDSEPRFRSARLYEHALEAIGIRNGTFEGDDNPTLSALHALEGDVEALHCVLETLVENVDIPEVNVAEGLAERLLARVRAVREIAVAQERAARAVAVQ